MEPTLAKFEHFLVARTANGADVELRSSSNEVVFLAFDVKIRRLVELHVLAGSPVMDKTARSAAFECCKLAAEVRSPSFMRILETGERDQSLYFSSNLTDGELAEDYVARRGPVPPVTVFCLMQQFLEDLLTVPNLVQLASHMRLNNPLVTMLEDTFLQLRIVDYGMIQIDAPEESGTRRCVAECCRLLFLLLTGQAFEGQNPDQVPALTCLPMGLRTQMRAALIDPAQAPASLERLRDDVREAYSALVSNLQVRTSRKHIVVTEALQPQSQLKELLLANVPIKELLKGRFAVADGDDVRGHPFSISAVNIKTDQPVTVHLLPPSSIVERDQYEAVPLQMWRFNPERHPNILRSLSLWENPEWTLLTEEREPGFALSRLMAERIFLNPTEVLALLRQVRGGMEQAMECGVRTVDLHPSNLVLRVGKGGPTQAREFERLMQKRVDAWPPFAVKLRTHLTMRSLYEPLLVEAGDESPDRDSHLAERDLRHRTFLALAVYLLTGERQAGCSPAFGEAVPDTLAAYLRGCLEAGRQADRTPSPSDFIEAFEQRMGQPSPEGRGIAAIMAASAAAPAGDIEDAGAISDFDEDWAPPSPIAAVLKPKAGSQSLSMPAFGQHRSSMSPGKLGMYMWAGATLAILLVGRFVLFGGSRPAPSPAMENPTAIAVRATNIPAVAARFSSAPSVASQTPPSPTAGVKLLSTESKASKEAADSATETPHVIARPGIAPSHAVAATAPPSSPPSAPAGSAPPAVAPVVATTPPVAPHLAATESSAPPVVKAESNPAATAPASVDSGPLDGPITIKKAIVPSAKEVSDIQKGHSGAAAFQDRPSSSNALVEGNGGSFH